MDRQTKGGTFIGRSRSVLSLPLGFENATGYHLKPLTLWNRFASSSRLTQHQWSITPSYYRTRVALGARQVLNATTTTTLSLPSSMLPGCSPTTLSRAWVLIGLSRVSLTQATTATMANYKKSRPRQHSTFPNAWTTRKYTLNVPADILASPSAPCRTYRCQDFAFARAALASTVFK